MFFNFHFLPSAHLFDWLLIWYFQNGAFSAFWLDISFFLFPCRHSLSIFVYLSRYDFYSFWMGFCGKQRKLKGKDACVKKTIFYWRKSLRQEWNVLLSQELIQFTLHQFMISATIAIQIFHQFIVSRISLFYFYCDDM